MSQTMGKAENDAIQRVRVAQRDCDSHYLREALSDPVVRSWAARYLGKLGVTDATPALIRLLAASDWKARVAAADALGMLRAPAAVPDLMLLAETDSDLSAQTHAIVALGEIGDGRAVPMLVRLLGSPTWNVRVSAAVALGRFADEAVLPTLQAARRRERFYLRGTYRKAIRRIRQRGETQRR